LIPSLAIAREDFKRIEFEQAGATWNGMDRDFDGALADLIADLNETVASWPGCVHLLYNVVTEADMGEQTVGVRELKARLSEYLRQVKKGRTVVITEHGKPVGRLVPAGGSLEERLQAMVDAGLAEWNGKRLPPARPVAEVRDGFSVADLLIEDRR